MGAGHTIYIDGQFPKACACGWTYTQEQWERLPPAGIMSGEDEKGRRFGADLELRHCICKSTIGVSIKSF